MRYWIVFLFLLLISCSKNGERSDLKGVVRILINSQMEINDGCSFELSRVLVPESKSGTLFKDINKVLVKNDLVYVLDAFGSKSAFIYRRDGSCVRRIGKQGKGPAEFLNLIDFNINESSGYLEIMDSGARLIQCYDSIGNYVKKIEIGFNAANFISFDENYYFYMANRPSAYGDNTIKHNIITHDGYKIVNMSMPIKQLDGFYYRMRGFDKLIIDQQNAVYLNQRGSLEICKIAGLAASPDIVIDFGKDFVSKEDFDRMTQDMNYYNYEVEKTNKVYALSSFRFLDNYLFFSYLKGGRVYYTVFNRDARKVNYNGTKEDFILKFVGFSKGSVIGSFKDALIVSIPASEFRLTAQKGNLGEEYESFASGGMFERIQDSSNDIILFINIIPKKL